MAYEVFLGLYQAMSGTTEEDKLYKIASGKLQKINPFVIAITGSVGKTTMRDFIFTILSQKYKVCKGSLNTKLGLAVNIVNDMKYDDEVFVAETGMDRAGELLETGNFIRPNIAVITNVSRTHIEKLGSFENIKKAKAELLQTIRPGGSVFINWDDQGARSLEAFVPKSVLIEKFGTQNGIAYNKKFVEKTIYDASLDPEEWYKFEEIPFKFIGRHNKILSIGAAAIGSYLKTPPFELRNGILNLETPNGRLKLLEGVGGSTLIDDTYNSSPVSACSALEAVSDYYNSFKLHGRKIAILGGMLELGDYEDEGHKLVGDVVSKFHFDILVLVGDLAVKIKKSLLLKDSSVTINHYPDGISTGEFVKKTLKPQNGDIILVKASQGIRLEKAVEILMKDPKRASNLLVRQDARWK